MKQLLILFLLLVSIIGKSQDIDKLRDSIQSIFLNADKIEPCSNNFYTSVDNEPKLKKSIESEFAKIDIKKFGENLEFDFALGVDINCKGEVGNWDVMIVGTVLKSSANFQLLSEIAKALSHVTNPAICTSGNKPVNYHIKYFPVKISEGKIYTKFIS